MKRFAVFSLFVVLVLLTVLSGCTSSQPAPQPVVVSTAPATATPAPLPTPTPNPYPNASALNTPLPFGTAPKNGEMTVTAYKIKPTFSWVDPSWNSQREQNQYQGQLETQKGYNTQKPAEGNTFVFIYLSATATGTEAAWAPSPGQIVLNYEGKNYPYTSVASSETTVDGETLNQYDYELGTGHTGGYVKTGKSNTVKGFLIYEVPAAFAAEKSFVVASLYSDKQGAWKLV